MCSDKFTHEYPLEYLVKYVRGYSVECFMVHFTDPLFECILRQKYVENFGKASSCLQNINVVYSLLSAIMNRNQHSSKGLVKFAESSVSPKYIAHCLRPARQARAHNMHHKVLLSKLH